MPLKSKRRMLVLYALAFAAAGAVLLLVLGLLPLTT